MFMFTLDNFDKQAFGSILQRGKDYFKNGLVAELEELDKNTWNAEVYGSDDYSVTVVLNDKNAITGHHCDCPYDGAICKHVLAVCYAIREKKKIIIPISSSSKNTFDNLLKKLSLEECIAFIRWYTTQNKNFKTEVELYFADKNDSIDIEQKYGDLIQKLIRKHSDRGFFDYRATRALAFDLGRFTENGLNMIAKQNFKDAFLLTKVLLKEQVEIISSCDDSSGSLGGAISETIEILDVIMKSDSVAFDLKQQIFDYLEEQLNNSIYFDYGDYGYDLFSLFYDFAVDANQSERFIRFVDKQISKPTDGYRRYRQESFLKAKIEFLTETGKQDDASKLMSENMAVVEIRQQIVEDNIKNKDYKTAKQLIREGIKLAEEKGHSGTASRWNRKLLDIAVLENDLKTVRKLTFEFAFDREFSKEYYRQWKQTYPNTEWTEVIESYIADTIKRLTAEYQKNKRAWSFTPNPPLLQYLAPVYIEEGYWNRLLDLVKTDGKLDTLLCYHSHLFKKYPSELLDLYIPAFLSLGKRVSDRKSYAELASKMKMVIKDIQEGKDRICAVAQKIITENPRRPAMIEELKKVLD